MKLIRSALLCLGTCFLTHFTVMAQSSPVMGFSEEGAADQLSIEANFDELLNAENLDQWMKYMTARPHHVGSDYDKKVVDFIAGKFQE